MKHKKILVVAVGKYHDFKYHDFKYAARYLSAQLANSGWFEVQQTDDCDALKSLESFDGVVFYAQNALTPEQERSLTEFVAGGKGFLGIHCANVPAGENPAYRAMIGSRFLDHAPGIQFYPVTISKKEHPLAAGMYDFNVVDEFYHCEFDTDLDVFLSALWQGQMVPLAYTKTHGKGRVCYITIGHDARALEHQEVSRLLVRAARWTTGIWPETPRLFRWATIGYGGAFNMGKHHLLGAVSAGMKPLAVCDADPKRLEVAQQDFPGIRTYQKVDELLCDTEVDGVTVILPHNLHGPVGLQALRAGKHVIMEKPFVTRLAEADTMIAAAKETGLMLTVYHNRRWDADFLRIEEIVRSGAIGEVFQIECCLGGFGRPGGAWWRDDKTVSGGLMFDWGAHFLFWIYRLMPLPVTAVDGYLHKRRWHHVTNEDHGLIVIRFEGGKTASLEISHLAAIGKPWWRILGTAGAIESTAPAQDHRIRVVRYSENLVRHEELVPTQPSRVPGSFGSPVNPFYLNVYNHLAFGEPLEITAEEARHVIATLEAAEHASYQGKPQPFP